MVVLEGGREVERGTLDWREGGREENFGLEGREGGMVVLAAGREGSFIVEGCFGSREGGREGGREGSFIVYVEGCFGSREGGRLYCRRLLWQQGGREGGKLYCRRLLWQQGGREGGKLYCRRLLWQQGGREGGKLSLWQQEGREALLQKATLAAGRVVLLVRGRERRYGLGGERGRKVALLDNERSLDWSGSWGGGGGGQSHGNQGLGSNHKAISSGEGMCRYNQGLMGRTIHTCT